jgi:hypothetical protein
LGEAVAGVLSTTEVGLGEVEGVGGSGFLDSPSPEPRENTELKARVAPKKIARTATPSNQD